MLEISTPVLRIRVLAAVAEAEAVAGWLDRAFATVDRIFTEAAAVDDDDTRVRVALSVAGTLATIGPADRAIGVARSIGGRAERIRTLGLVARAFDRAGLPGRAVAVLDSIVDLQEHEDYWHLVPALVDTDRWRRAHDVVREAPDRHRDSLTNGLVRALTEAGEYEQALGAALSGIADDGTRDGAVSHVACAMARAAAGTDEHGYAERALALARDRIVTDRSRSSALHHAGEALHRLGRTDRAVEVLRLGLTVALGMTESGIRSQEIREIATALAVAGHPEPGVAAINRMARDQDRTLALVAMAKTLVAAGDTLTAAAVLETAPVPPQSDVELGVLASVMIGLVEAGRADKAEALARGRTGMVPRNRALVTVATALARAGDLGRAAEILDGVEADILAMADPDPFYGSYLLVWTADARIRTGRPDRAAALLEQAAGYVPEIYDPDHEQSLWLMIVGALVQADRPDRATAAARAAGLVPDLVNAMVKAGDPERAEAVAAEDTGPGRNRSLYRAATGWIGVGQLDRAGSVATSIADPELRAEVLTALARAQIEVGQRDRAVGTLRLAEPAAREAGGSGTRVRAVVEAMLAVGGLDLAARTLREAESAARDRPDVLVDVWCSQGRPRRAFRVAQEITDPLDRCRALMRVVVGYRAVGRASEAASVVLAAKAAAEAVVEPERQASAWAHVASAWTVHGEPDRARDAMDRAVAVAGPAPAPAVAAELRRAQVAIGYGGSAGDDPTVLDSERAATAAALARSGEVDRALSVARSVTDADLREHAVAEVAVALARSGTAAGALALLRPDGSP